MKIIENSILPPKGYKAITLLNCILVRRGVKLTDTDLRHEAIHWEQQKELLIVGFYILYVFEFLLALFRYRNWHRAYRSITFEREAYDNQDAWFYLEARKHYAWAGYIKHKSI